MQRAFWDLSVFAYWKWGEHSFHSLEQPFSLICSCESVFLGLTFDHHKPADILKTTNTTWIGENGREGVFSFTLSSCCSILRATNSTPLLLSYQRMMNTNFRSLSLSFSSFLMASSVSFPYFSSSWWLMVSFILSYASLLWYLKWAIGKIEDSTAAFDEKFFFFKKLFNSLG